MILSSPLGGLAIRMSIQVHTSDSEILDRRTLERDHRRLAAALQPGMTVLDVGCGTGAITAGIARAVAPRGRVVGIDRDPALLQLARERFDNVPGLSFEECDVLAFTVTAHFDIVTAARTLQWIDQPKRALERMRAAAKPGALVIVLDYNHARLAWEPAPPAPVRRFYDALLEWRATNGWDNMIGDHLPSLFAQAGLTQMSLSNADEIARRGEPEFEAALRIWQRVIETLGPSIIAAGFLSGPEQAAALDAYTRWRSDAAQRQHMVLRAVEGRA